MFQNILCSSKRKPAQYCRLAFITLQHLRSYSYPGEQKNKIEENKSIVEQKEDRTRVPICDRDGEWRSAFALFAPEKGITVDVVAFMSQPIDFWPSTMKRRWARKREEKEIADQMFIPDRVEILGCNLAAAHFIVHRGGAVKFIGHSDWVRKNEEDEYDLPDKYDKNFVVEAIDASGTGLRYEGLETLRSLRRLRSLNLANCPHIDDWCLDRISGEYQYVLESLDVSGCPCVSERGLSSLSRLKNLKVLSVDNLQKANFLPLTSLMLEEVLPNLAIKGVEIPTLESLQLESGEEDDFDEGSSQIYIKKELHLASG